MKKQIYNPYLPSWEYVPDGEPHVFGGRVYVYGSHDRFRGYAFCLNDYVCWSAPVNDLSDWRYEGVIYKKTDDPKNTDGEMCLYAPDVVMGADGKYYLYYVLDLLSIVSVAVCDTPAGKYEFYGYVHYVDGTLLGEGPEDEPQFDPGVLFENGKVYMYTGFCPPAWTQRSGPMVTVLGADMLTIEEKPEFIAPSAHRSRGSGYEGHEFFEAPSIRKINGKYYFIYSSVVMHELCYAVSDSPTQGFVYGGVIVSNTDIGIDTYKPMQQPMAYGANNHGSIACVNGDFYIFYHRHTNGNSYNRQGCAEKIVILPDGSIPQVEITSGGMNGPLKGEGEYPAYIACHLFCKTQRVYTGDQIRDIGPEYPRITQDGRDGDEETGYVANMEDGAVAGFRYFDCQGITGIRIKARGLGNGRFEILTHWNGDVYGEIPYERSNEWKWREADIVIPDGIQSLYIRYRGEGNISLAAFELCVGKSVQ
ncbi:family 43 glycosylhydrolase [Blautia schinkii]|nr:family 43 glycosylhydrolase [Blautia schinkii]